MDLGTEFVFVISAQNKEVGDHIAFVWLADHHDADYLTGGGVKGSVDTLVTRDSRTLCAYFERAEAINTAEEIAAWAEPLRYADAVLEARAAGADAFELLSTYTSRPPSWLDVAKFDEWSLDVFNEALGDDAEAFEAALSEFKAGWDAARLDSKVWSDERPAKPTEADNA